MLSPVQTLIQTEIQPEEKQQEPHTKPQTEPHYEWNIVWRNILLYAIMHTWGAVGLYYVIFNAQWKTTLWCWFLLYVGLQGITSGVHRLWCHRTYKAKLPLRILLCVFQTIALQNSIYKWAVDHRVHHKYVDTDADPHNSKRGLFFSHVGWLFIESQPEVIEKTKAIDVSDLKADSVVMFQKKYYFFLLAPVIGFILPAVIPWYYWNEDIYVSFFVSSMLRYALCTNITFLVNSFAHKYGTKPYDKNLRPTDNLSVTLFTGGEGWHNYHHVFPWDYKTGELGDYATNISTGFIDLMAKIGWAYDLKTVSDDMVKKRVNRTGDGTRSFADDPSGEENDSGLPNDHLWGWGDDDMKKEDLSFVEIHHRKNA